MQIEHLNSNDNSDKTIEAGILVKIKSFILKTISNECGGILGILSQVIRESSVDMMVQHKGQWPAVGGGQAWI